MKPTEHTAKPAAAPKTGRFALLRGPHRAPGSGAPARGLIAAPFVARSLVVLCALAGLFALPPPPSPKPNLPSSSPTDRSARRSRFAVGVAVEGSGDLFVSGLFGEGFAPSTVVKLDPSGNLLSPPSPFGSAYYSGVAVNPTNGDVYVLGEEGFSRRPRRSSSTTPTRARCCRRLKCRRHAIFGGVFTDVQIAADSAGNVYVPDGAGKRGARVQPERHAAEDVHGLRRRRAQGTDRGRDRLLRQPLGGRLRQQQDRGARFQRCACGSERQARGNRKRRRVVRGTRRAWGRVRGRRQQRGPVRRNALALPPSRRVQRGRQAARRCGGRQFRRIKVASGTLLQHGRGESSERACIRDRRRQRHRLGVRASRPRLWSTGSSPPKSAPPKRSSARS